MSVAGAKAQLQTHPAIELVGPADLDRARVALVIADAVDETAARVVRAIQRDGIPRVVLVAARFDEAGVVSAVAAGVTSFLRRSEATSIRLAEVIRQADQAGCQLPEGLLKKAAASASGFSGPAPVGTVRPGAGPGEGAPAPVMAASNGNGSNGAGPGAQDGAGTGTAVLGLAGVAERGGTTVTSIRLSNREAEVLRLVADGYDTSDIAEHLAYSESTIKGVLAKLMGRLEARNRCHAVAIVVREGLI
jgi:DNA-binding NarL/FixJ family response regulator